MKIYELIHVHGAEMLSDDRFHYGEMSILGYFTSREMVASSIERYRHIAGFRDLPNGFTVFEHEIEGDAMTVYVASYYIHDEEYEFEYSRNLGVFISESDARRAIETFRMNNSANWSIDKLEVELNVDKYILDKMYCIHGFDF